VLGAKRADSGLPSTISVIAIANTGSVRPRLTRKRRDMSLSSGFSSCSALGLIGSSAMPQIGHEAGSSRTISGCIGQVQRLPGAAARAGGGPPPAKLSGSSRKRARQRSEQKW
jgi:hypothetical protein